MLGSEDKLGSWVEGGLGAFSGFLFYLEVGWGEGGSECGVSGKPHDVPSPQSRPKKEESQSEKKEEENEATT